MGPALAQPLRDSGSERSIIEEAIKLSVELE
jgi:hypothetical protein